jgi:hypothetical protein
MPFKKATSKRLEEWKTGKLEYWNIGMDRALGSCGEFYSCYESCKQAGQIKEDEYEKLDQLHYKVENGLLKLIESLQKKQALGDWEDTFKS